MEDEYQMTVNEMKEIIDELVNKGKGNYELRSTDHNMGIEKYDVDEEYKEVWIDLCD